MSFRPRFAPEPPFTHGAPPGGAGASSTTAVLLCNLGTPDQPDAPALRRYLAQFLATRASSRSQAAVAWLILHGIILRVRPAKSAAKYATDLDARKVRR
jgi:ferrochelatase